MSIDHPTLLIKIVVSNFDHFQFAPEVNETLISQIWNQNVAKRKKDAFSFFIIVLRYESACANPMQWGI